VLNKAVQENIKEIYSLAKESDMEILGAIPFDENLIKGSITRDSNIVIDAVKNLYFRLNLPQENN
jgi:MinD superfamily P-loop ATPase